MYRSPGIDDERLKWILTQINGAQTTLDDRIAIARALPDTEPSKTVRIIRLNAVKREVNTAFTNLDKSVAQWAAQDVPSMYKSGWLVGTTDIGASFDFTLPHREALDIISYDAYTDVATRLQQINTKFAATADKQILYEGMDPGQILAIQDKSRSAVAQALLTGEADPRKVARGLADELWEEGVTIVDGGGNHWQMETYTRMLVRTKSANAYNAGSLNKYAESGVTRVNVYDGVLDDDVCAEANGQVWTLKYAMEHTIAHPNCKRAFSAKPGTGYANEGLGEEAAAHAAAGVKVAQKSITGFALMSQLLREFRHPEQFAPSRTLSQFAVRGAEAIIGVPLFFVDDFISGLVAAPLRQFDQAVESVINPAMYAAGLVEKMPSVGDIYRIKDPQRLIDALAGAVDAAAVKVFPTGSRQVSEASATVRTSAMRTMIASGLVTIDKRFVAHIRRTQLLRLVDLAGVPQLAVNRYGQIVSEVFSQWSKGNSEQLKLLFRQSAQTVDNLSFIRKAANDLYRSTGQEAILVRRDIDTKIRALQQYLNVGFFAVDDQRSLVRLLDAEGLGGVAEFKLTPQRRKELEDMLDRLTTLREYADQKVTELAHVNARNFGGVPDPIELTAFRLTDEMRADGVKSLAEFRASKVKGSLAAVPSVAPAQLSIVEEVSVQRHIDDVKKRADELRGPRRPGESIEDWRARADVVTALDEVARLMESTQEFAASSNPTAQKILTKLREPIAFPVPPPSAPKIAITGKKLNAPARGTPTASAVPSEATPEEVEKFSAVLEALFETTETTVFNPQAFDDLGVVFRRLDEIVQADLSSAQSQEILSFFRGGQIFDRFLIEIMTGDPNSTGVVIGTNVVLQLTAVLMNELTIKGSKLFYGGTEIAWNSPVVSALVELFFRFDREMFTSSRIWLDQITAGADTMMLLRHLGIGYQTDPGNAASRMFLFFKEGFLTATRGAKEVEEFIGGQSANLSNFARILTETYGVNNVEKLGTSGVNGTVWRVTDADGAVFVVKPVLTSGSGDVEAGMLSFALSKWVDDYLMDGTAAIPTTVIKLDGEDEYLGIMRFFEGGMWEDVAYQLGDDIPDEQVRRMRIFDMLSGERDGHSQNFMFDSRTGVSYSIDNEMTGGANQTIRGIRLSDHEDGGLIGGHVPTVTANERAVSAWLTGSVDDAKGVNGLPVRLIELTDDEAITILDQFNYYTVGGGNVMLKRIADTVNYPMGIPFKIVVVTDLSKPSGYRVYIPAGRTGVALADTGAVLPKAFQTFTIPLSGTESKKIRALAELSDPAKRAGSPIVADINDAVRSAIETMTPTTQARVMLQHSSGATTIDSLVDNITDQTVNVFSRRATILLEDMTVTDHPLTKARGKNGVIVELGEAIDVVQENGDEIQGLVISIFVDEVGVTRIHYIPGLGLGLDELELASFPMASTPAILDDLFDSVYDVRRLSNLTPEDEIFIGVSTSKALDAATPTPLEVPKHVTNPRVVELPRVDGYGIRTSYDEQHIPYFVSGRPDKGIRVVGRDGKEGFVSWSQIEDSGVLQEILDEELAKIPAAYRPREIVLHFDEIVTTDGKSAFGYVEVDTRRMHVSYAAALTDARMRTTVDGVTGYNIRASVAGDDVADIVRSIGEANKQLDGFRELVRHELGHVVKTAVEEQVRARIVVSVWENLADMYGTLPSDRASLNALIQGDDLIPKSFDVSLYRDHVEAFVAYRTQVVEDVLNSNLVVIVDSLFESAIEVGDMPAWMSRAYGDIRRGDPDAYQEFFAELWVRVLQEGGDDTALQRVARDMFESAVEDDKLHKLRRLLNVNDADSIGVPSGRLNYTAAEVADFSPEDLDNARRGLAQRLTEASLRDANWTRTDRRRIRTSFGTELDVEPIARFRQSDEWVERIEVLGGTIDDIYEIESDAAGAQVFHDAIVQSKKNHRFGASVSAYSVDEYQEEGMRLFLYGDGSAGFAITGDGQLISVFNGTADNRMPLHSFMPLAIREGAVRADAYDTVLPHFYADFGFHPKTRLEWNHDYRPDDWDYPTFKKFNNGRPDVVFLKFEPEKVGVPYEPGAGRYVGDYDDGLASTEFDPVGVAELRALLSTDIPVLPQMMGWDLEDPIFHRWLLDSLDERVTKIVPKSRSVDRKLWKLKRPIGIELDDLVDDIVEQLKGGDGGGATIHIHTGAVPEGDVVTVARGANETRVKGVTEKSLKRTLEKFINTAENRQFLDQEQWSLGIWLQADGEIVIDVSMVFDDPIDAAIFGFKEGQQAGFRFSDFKDENYLRDYADFDEWFEARGRTILAERGIELTDDLYNAITQRVGAAYANLVPHRRREVRGTGGKHQPVGMDIFLSWQQAKLAEAAETKFVVGVKEGKKVVATSESVVITHESAKASLEKVLERAVIEYNLVPRNLTDDEWMKARNIVIEGVDVSEDEVTEFIAELREAYDLMDRLGIRAPGMLDQPGKFHNNTIVFTLESGKKMQKYGATAKAPNGASTLGYTHINRTWRDLPGSLSRSRLETIIHEIGHQVDPKGYFGKVLRSEGFSPSDLGSAATYARISDDEFFAEAFLAVLTGRASPDLHRAIVGFEFLPGEIFAPIGIVELDRGAALRILHRFYEDWNAQYKAMSAETLIPMWKLVGVAAILSPGMTAEVNRDAAAFMIKTWADNPRIAGSQVTRLRKYLLETVADIREAAIKDKGYVPKKTEATLLRLEAAARKLTGKHIQDYGDELSAYAVAFLAQESGIMVSQTMSLSLTGAYGMPQVIRAMKVTSGTYTLDDGLGNTKTRSFYNNIMDPKNLYRAGDVTIDFHMANAAVLMIGMQKLKHSLPTVMGMEAGLRPLIGDIVRELYDEGWGDLVHSDSPAELQEVIWALWRASTDWEKEQLWFGDMRIVTDRPNWKSAHKDAEWRRLIP